MTTKQIQSLLAYLGLYDGEIDGKLGPQTRAAAERFQRRFGGLAVDGKPGPATQEALKRAVAGGLPEESGGFWDAAPHFKREEFRCKCGGKYCSGFPAEPQEALVRAAEKVRAHFGAPVNLSSGLRCRQHNADVGGVYNSRHLTGRAMDFTVKGLPAAEVLAYVKTLPEIKYAYIINNGPYVHMDIGQGG